MEPQEPRSAVTLQTEDLRETRCATGRTATGNGPDSCLALPVSFLSIKSYPLTGILPLTFSPALKTHLLPCNPRDKAGKQSSDESLWPTHPGDSLTVKLS